jgi:hypothetical protein
MSFMSKDTFTFIAIISGLGLLGGVTILAAVLQQL